MDQSQRLVACDSELTVVYDDIRRPKLFLDPGEDRGDGFWVSEIRADVQLAGSAFILLQAPGRQRDLITFSGEAFGDILADVCAQLQG